ncbi:MAG: hypothetical protein Q9172_007586 [Xanthocarpia lactea]
MVTWLDGYDSMLPTPSTSHVDFDRVYEPAEDSFLLLDTLSSTTEIAFLKERFTLGSGHAKPDASIPSPLIVEVGTGSGVVLAFITAHAQTLFGRTDIVSLGVDINQHACRASVHTVEKACRDIANNSRDASRPVDAGLLLTSVNGDLTSAIRPGSVDVLIFNPPYVPTSDVPTACAAIGSNEDMQSCLDADSDILSLSFAGGLNGMEVTNRLLEQLPSALNPDRGIAYILLCKQNKPEQVAQRIRLWGAEWTVDIVGQSGKQAGWEKLQILRICRGSQSSFDN